MEPVAVTVVYDNYPGDVALRTGHGFACIVKGFDKTVLFDTGWSGPILRENMHRLSFSPDAIDVVVLSHMHWDHIGGLDIVLDGNRRPVVYAPRSFSGHLKEEIRRNGATVVETEHPESICPGVWTTQVLTGTIDEQALCIHTEEGTTVVTGCAHPGIVNLARAAGEAGGFPLYAALGGFHMGGASADTIQSVIAEIRELGVRAVAPCHCSGDLARHLFKKAYGKDYHAAGVGWQLTLGKAQRETPEIE